MLAGLDPSALDMSEMTSALFALLAPDEEAREHVEEQLLRIDAVNQRDVWGTTPAARRNLAAAEALLGGPAR